MRVLATATLLAATASAFVPIGRPSVNGADVKKWKSVADELAKLDLPSADDAAKATPKVEATTASASSQKRSDASTEQIPKVITLPLHRRTPRKLSPDPITSKTIAASSAASRYHRLTPRQNDPIAPLPPSDSFPSSIPATDPPTADSLGIAQDGNDFSYFSTLRFGSSQKPFLLVIDTGSADTWIPSSSCSSTACGLQTTFSPADSDTVAVSTRTFRVEYGAGEVDGVVARDTIAFAGFNITAGFGLATNVSDDFVNFQIDGILGLGFTASSQMRVKTVMDELKDQGEIDQRIYGIALSRASSGINDGVINFGGVDPDLFEGDLTFTASSQAKGLWELPLGEVKVGDSTVRLRGGRSAVIDTGTSLMILPPNDAMRLHALIPGAFVGGQTFVIPCNTDRNISVAFSGKSYNIPPVDYVGSPVLEDDGQIMKNNGQDLCVSLIDGRSILDSSTWLLGDVFLKNVYSVFDLDAKRIGFGVRRTRGEEGEEGRTLEGVPTVEETGNGRSSGDEDEDEKDAAGVKMVSWGVLGMALGVAMYGSI